MGRDALEGTGNQQLVEAVELLQECDAAWGAAFGKLSEVQDA